MIYERLAYMVGKALKDISERSLTGRDIVKSIISNSISLRRWGRIITMLSGMAALILYGLFRCPSLIYRWMPLPGVWLTYGHYHILFSVAWLYFSVVLVIRAVSMLICDSVKILSERP